jgi:hypothetical protein
MKHYLYLTFKGLNEAPKVLKYFRDMFLAPKIKVFIVSYQKTGRTWIRFMVGKYLCEKYNIKDKNLLDIYKLTNKANLKPALFTHGGKFNLYDFSQYNKLKFKNRKFKKKEIVFIIRDIRDVLVSHYYQFSKRENFFNGTLSDFIRDKRFGVKKIIHFYNLWYNNQKFFNGFVLIRYEEVKKNPCQEMRKVLSFLGEKNIDNNLLKFAVDYSSFDNMKKLENSGVIADSALKSKNKSDRDSSKVRKGKVGGYKDDLSSSDIIYIENAVKKYGLTGCDWYFNI